MPTLARAHGSARASSTAARLVGQVVADQDQSRRRPRRCARASTASRSASKAGSIRWACVSTRPGAVIAVAPGRGARAPPITSVNSPRGGVLLEVRQRGRGGAAKDLLEVLGQLAADGDRAGRARASRPGLPGLRPRDAATRRRPASRRCRRAAANSLRRVALVRGRKPRKQKAWVGRPEATSAVMTRRGAGHGHHLVAGRQRVADQRKAGIGDAGRARVGDQRHVALGQAIDQPAAAGGRGELVEAGQRGVDVVGTEEGARDARVLGGDQRHLFEDAQGAQGDVFEIADGRGHDVQRPHVVFSKPSEFPEVYDKTDRWSGCTVVARAGAVAGRPVVRRDGLWLVSSMDRCGWRWPNDSTTSDRRSWRVEPFPSAPPARSVALAAPRECATPGRLCIQGSSR